METLEFIKRSVEEKIIIDVPENLKGKDVVVTLKEAAGDIDLSSVTNVTDIMKYYGTAKFPDIDLEKFNVYEQ